MGYDISKQEIDKLIKKAQSAKVYAPGEIEYDGDQDAKRISATIAYLVLQTLGIEVEIDKDF